MQRIVLLFFILLQIYCFSSDQTLVVSDRGQFYNPDKLSRVQTKKVLSLSPPYKAKKIRENEWQKKIAGKKIAVLIHGYNNGEKEYSFFSRIINKGGSIYDTYICYSWPGGDNFWEYLAAKRLIIRTSLPHRLLALLQELSQVAERVDVIAHSMGCRLILESLKLSSSVTLGNLFLMAPAIDNEALEKGESYFPATSKAAHIFVFFSQNDEVLSLLYPMMEWDLALGSRGPENPKLLLDHIHLIKSDNYIHAHKDYADSDFVFNIISHALQVPSSPSTARLLHCLVDCKIIKKE